MSHHNAVEGAESSWIHTLVSAAVCGILAQRYYQKAIVGVTGDIMVLVLLLFAYVPDINCQLRASCQY